MANLEVTPNHHLQYQEQLSVGDEPVPVHIVDFERDWVHSSIESEFSTVVLRRTPQFLLSPSPTAKCAQTPNEFLEIYRSTTTIVQWASVGQVDCHKGGGTVRPWSNGATAEGVGQAGRTLRQRLQSSLMPGDFHQSEGSARTRLGRSSQSHRCAAVKMFTVHRPVEAR